MIKIPYEIPTEIRDLTAKSVEDARKAFGSFIEAAHKATAQAEGTANALQSSTKDVSAKALSFTEANLKAVFDHAQKLIQAKDPQEILAQSVRICEEAARRHGGACEVAGHRCPEGRDAGQVITTFLSQGRLVILLGQKKAGAIAVKNVSGRRRWSKLREWLNPVTFLAVRSENIS
jgi:Phasin protein